MMDLDFYNLHIDQVEDLPIFAPVNNRNFSLKKVREQIIEAKKTRDIKMVYIDHLHFLLPFSAAERNSSFVLGAVMRELKQMAVELEVAVLLIAHTKKIEIGVAPDINSIRDSSFISQESDFTVIIWRERLKVEKKNLDDNLDEDVYTKRTYVSLEAARRGRTRRMLFGVINGHFYNWETFQHMEQMPANEEEFKRDLKRREEYAQKEAEKAAAPQKAPEQTQMVVISEMNKDEQKKKAQDLLELADKPKEVEEVDEYGMTAQQRRDNLDSLFTW